MADCMEVSRGMVVQMLKKWVYVQKNAGSNPPADSYIKQVEKVKHLHLSPQ